jgi:hypothetical protein
MEVYLGFGLARPGMTRLMATGPCPGFVSGPTGQHDTAHFYSVPCEAPSLKA